MKKLTLNKDTLTELTAGDLAAVVAAAGGIPTLERCLTGVYPTIPVTACLPETG